MNHSRSARLHLKGNWLKEAGKRDREDLRRVFYPDCRSRRSEGSTEGALSGEKVDKEY